MPNESVSSPNPSGGAYDLGGPTVFPTLSGSHLDMEAAKFGFSRDQIVSDEAFRQHMVHNLFDNRANAYTTLDGISFSRSGARYLPPKPKQKAPKRVSCWERLLGEPLV